MLRCFRQTAEKKDYWLGSGDPRWASSEERKRRGDAVTTLATHTLLAGNAVMVLLVDIFDQVPNTKHYTKDYCSRIRPLISGLESVCSS